MKRNNIAAEEIYIGKNTIIEKSARLRGIHGNAKRIIIGDNCYIGKNVQIICDDFSLGDYSKIHHNTNIHGYLPCSIGHNAWIGQYSIIDSIGGTKIGNNCGIGAHSQLWSHIKFGDTLEGCRFSTEKSMEIGNDVWFVGHCIVSPIKAEDKSMAMAGSVITKNMKFNEIYAGSPAVSISKKIGFQFKEVNIEDKLKNMYTHLADWKGNFHSIKLVTNFTEMDLENKELTYFNVFDRTYTKRGSAEEISFMRYLLPSKAKFIPYEK